MSHSPHNPSGKARHVYGKNSVKAILETHPDTVFKIFLSDTLKPDKRLQAIQEICHERRIPVQRVPRQKLDQMLRDHRPENTEERNTEERHSDDDDIALDDAEQAINHQGVVASVAPKPLLTLDVLLKTCEESLKTGQYPRLLLLDSITDPRNLGAILRVADATGVQGVILPKHHSAGFGPGVSKTASGAEETVPIAVVSNLNQAILQLKKAGFWILGAAYESGAVPYNRQDYKMPVVLVMGSEDKGLAPLVRKNCDLLVQIPMHGRVESLNVATATAVLLFAMVLPPA